MTWRNGRQLSTVATGGKTYSYEYDANGLRTRRTNSDGGYTLYYIVDGLTVGEQQYTASGSIRRTMKYLLDENNSPVGVSVRYPSYSAGTWDNYYFLKNLQGDVTAIYNSSGALQARYTYDPYGNITSVTNASGAAIGAGDAHIANYNPFRYRGYHYDADTGFYYLKTRYYDPELGRFINADGYASTGQGILGCNMFAYCNNNVVNYFDPNGCALVCPYSILVPDGGSGLIDDSDDNYALYVETVAPGSIPPDSPNFKPPKGGNRKVKNPNGPGKGWQDSHGNVWVWTPGMHGGDGWTIQYPNGGHHHEYPGGHVRYAIPKTEITSPSPGQALCGILLAAVVVADDFLGIVADDGLLATACICFIPSEETCFYCEVCGESWK